MIRNSSSFILLLAVIVAGTSFLFGRSATGVRRHQQRRDVDRWEDEGGNVPEVALESGEQGVVHGLRGNGVSK